MVKTQSSEKAKVLLGRHFCLKSISSMYCKWYINTAYRYIKVERSPRNSENVRNKSIRMRTKRARGIGAQS